MYHSHYKLIKSADPELDGLLVIEATRPSDGLRHYTVWEPSRGNTQHSGPLPLWVIPPVVAKAIRGIPQEPLGETPKAPVTHIGRITNRLHEGHLRCKTKRQCDLAKRATVLAFPECEHATFIDGMMFMRAKERALAGVDSSETPKG